MQRKNIYLTDKELAALEAYAKQTGLRFSDIVRRIIDDWMRRIAQEEETR